MVEPKEFLEAGQAFHGHKCPAMPLGLRVGAAAMNKLGVERSKDGQLLALVELGDNHFATCFADGIQMITGCTFGKGNIRKLQYGKWGLTLVDVATRRAVRITPKAAVIQANMKSRFFTDYRMKAIPASKAPEEVVEPLIKKVMTAPDSALLEIGDIFEYEVPDSETTFSALVCNLCGELVVNDYVRHLDDKEVCIPCYKKTLQERAEQLTR